MNRRFVILAALVSSALMLDPPSAPAGTGSIQDGRVNLHVMFAYREQDPDSWRPLFEESSRLLWNATNGQLQLGTISVESCAFDKDKADVWILGDHSGAFANILGLGGEGHIYLSQTHRSVAGPALGQFGFVHEFGHYGFGAYDEYKGIATPLLLASAGEQTAPRALNQFCVSESDTVACIMDGGTTISPEHLRTEFCTELAGALGTRHNAGIEIGGIFYENAQQSLNHESCWETIARHANLSPPSSVDATPPPGLEPIEWQIVPGENRVMLCFDRSASMFLQPDRMAMARTAARMLVELLHAHALIEIEGEQVDVPGDYVGITSFAWNATLDAPIREFESEASKAATMAIIDALSASPSPSYLDTNLGGGLRTSLNDIQAQGSVPSCGESIVLLSDGGSDAGTDPRDLLPALKERGVTIYAIALGSDSPTDLLEEIAKATGGEFYHAASEEEIPDIVTAVATGIRAAGTVSGLDGFMAGQDELLTILIDGFAEEITAILRWDAGVLDMELTSPTGDLITLVSAEERPDVEGGQEGGLLYLRVHGPEQGQWTARVRAVDLPVPTPFSLTVHEEAREIDVRASTDREIYDWPASVHLQVSVTAGVPVAGAQVQCTIDPPTGGSFIFQVYDDGSPVHGDTWADDGVYNTVLSAFPADGRFTLRVHVVNETGTGPDPELPFVEDGPGPPQSIPPFVRETEVSIEVNPAFVIPGTLEFNPSTLNLQGGNGRVTCYLEFPPPYVIDQIDPTSVRLNDRLTPIARPTTVGDVDGDGTPDCLFKFERAALIDALHPGMAQRVRLSGRILDGTPFLSEATIRVTNPQLEHPVLVSPDSLVVGGTALIRWTVEAAEPVQYDGFVSADGGTTWRKIFGGVVGTGEYAWTVEPLDAAEAIFLVEAGSPEGVIRQSLSAPAVLFSAAAADDESATATRILGVSPNPSQGSVNFRFLLGAGADGRLEIYDPTGRLVRVLPLRVAASGSSMVTWDGRDRTANLVPSGIYRYVFLAGSVRSTGSLALIR